MMNKPLPPFGPLAFSEVAEMYKGQESARPILRVYVDGRSHAINWKNYALDDLLRLPNWLLSRWVFVYENEAGDWAFRCVSATDDIVTVQRGTVGARTVPLNVLPKDPRPLVERISFKGRHGGEVNAPTEYPDFRPQLSALVQASRAFLKACNDGCPERAEQQFEAALLAGENALIADAHNASVRYKTKRKGE